MLILITYDIPNNRRRNKIAKTLLDYGERVQYSVFECELQQKQYIQLQAELKEIIDEEKDSIRFYSLCANCRENVITLGIAQPPTDDPVLYIV